MNTVVFLGPSLDRQTASGRLDATYAAPARRGDLMAAVNGGANRIALIDGEFGQSLAISVMEIRGAMEAGAEVWGASSMGALRAAECHRIGMRGAGWIFEQYAAGSLAADDEVALLFDPQTGQARTIPLVNLRWTVSLMQQRGLLSAAMGNEIVRLAASLHFSERSRDALSCTARGQATGPPMECVLDFMKENPQPCDRKQMDALLLLDRLATA